MTDTTKTAPTVGRTVHYTDNPNFGGGHARCFEAEVLNVNPDGTLDVEASEDDAATRAFAIHEGGRGELYTWHCCHRLDAHEHTADGWSMAVRDGAL